MEYSRKMFFLKGIVGHLLTMLFFVGAFFIGFKVSRMSIYPSLPKGFAPVFQAVSTTQLTIDPKDTELMQGVPLGWSLRKAISAPAEEETHWYDALTSNKKVKYVVFYSGNELHYEYVLSGRDNHIETKATTSTLFQWQDDEISKCITLIGHPAIDERNGTVLTCFEDYIPQHPSLSWAPKKTILLENTCDAQIDANSIAALAYNDCIKMSIH